MKLSSVIDEVVNICFTPEEKEILEIKVNNVVVSSVAQQFIAIYKNRCYFGTKEQLIAEFSHVVESSRFIIHKMRDIQNNIKRLLIPGLYNTTRYINSDYSTSSAMVHTGKSISSSNVDSFDINTSDSTNVNSVLNINQSGTSENNDLDELSSIIREHSIESLPKKKVNLEVNAATKTFTKTEEEGELQPKIVTTPSKINRQYQNLSYDQTSSFDSTYGYDSATSVSGDKTRGEENSANLSTNLGGGSKRNSVVTLNENDARIRAWKLELPALREEFFGKFHYLFPYAHRN